ncbi:MAG: nucleoside-diphosphate kinase [Phycisphaerae bacterium]|jgi:nucleoside diphosphate kinase|nr:nucleoside-diphosphate kinase [Phycisphaerae bacterium]
MSRELAYALITPYSLYKSRTGGIIGRLLAHPSLELVAARMFVFSDEFINEYQKVICPDAMDKGIEEAWHAYIDECLRKDNPWGVVPRCMLLLLRGENAVRCLKEEIIGSFTEQPVGDTVRGTFGDLIRDRDGNIRHFEPAVITCPDPALNDRHLKLLADHAVEDGGILEGLYEYGAPNVECSLVMLKPDNFYRPSRRPGNIIDTFSLTDLRIVGVKLFNMTVAKGQEFYGPLKEIFASKLKFLVSKTAMGALSEAFEFEFTEDDADVLADHLAERNAACEFNKIVEYMTGVDPNSIDESEKATATNAKCLAMLYEGPNAISKVRHVLGSTDPSKAEPGTVRHDFGRDLMRNGAHASDSPDNAIREREIVGLLETETDTCDVAALINAYLNDR